MKDNVRSKRLFLLAVTLVLATAWGTTGVSYAIINGEPDGYGHPYVGAVHNNEVFCSGAVSLHIYS